MTTTFRKEAHTRVRRRMTRFFKTPIGIASLIMTAVYVLGGVGAPILSPHDPLEMDNRHLLSPPSWRFLCGTDQYGRDILSRIFWGARNSLVVSLLSVAIAVAVGLPLGLASGYFGGAVDNAIMRVMDVLFAFPAILLAILLVTMLGGRTVNVAGAIGIVYSPIFARVVRGSVLSNKTNQFVEAAVALGASDWRIIWKHMFPNVVTPLITQVTISLSTTILTEATLSFLGLGCPPPLPSLGRMVSEARPFLQVAPWTVVAPGLAIMFAVLGINILGDQLRDVADPYS